MAIFLSLDVTIIFQALPGFSRNCRTPPLGSNEPPNFHQLLICFDTWFNEPKYLPPKIQVLNIKYIKDQLRDNVVTLNVIPGDFERQSGGECGLLQHLSHGPLQGWPGDRRKLTAVFGVPRGRNPLDRRPISYIYLSIYLILSHLISSHLISSYLSIYI